MDRGKRERGVRGTDPRPHLELGWRVEVARRERAAAVGEWLRRRRCGSRGVATVGGEVVWMVVELGGPFIAELRRSGRSSAVMAGRGGQGGVRRAVRGSDVTARAGGERG